MKINFCFCVLIPNSQQQQSLSGITSSNDYHRTEADEKNRHYITHVTHVINFTHVINDNNDTDATDVGIAIEQLQEKESRKHCCFRDSHLKKKAASYSPTLHCSTIGASGLNFSVRNGKRWNPAAITT